MVDVWNLKDILTGKTIEETELYVTTKVDEFVSLREELSPHMSPVRLLEIIKLEEDIDYYLGNIGSYYGMQFQENMQNQEALAMMTKYQQLGTDIANKTMFFGLWFMSLADEDAQKYINAPELKDYRYHLESIRHDKPYTKSEEIEQIINLKSITGRAAFADVYQIFTGDFSYDINGVKKNVSEVIKEVHSRDPATREQHYQVLLAKFGEHKSVLAELYKNIVLDWYNTGVKIRGHKNALSIRDHVNDIEDSAVQALLHVVRKNASVFHEYFKLKHTLNGESYDYSRYHLYAPYAHETEKQYSYEESKRIILEAYKEFDEHFFEAAQSIFDAKHVHSHPQKNKRSGAFCSFMGRGVAPYILLNHTDRLRDVQTMMHEFGHGIHDILADIHPLSVAHPCLPMAETGSITGETILADKMLRTASLEEKISLLISNIDDRWASIVRQVYFVLFEQEAHTMIRDGATSDQLDAKYMELLREQFGDMHIPAEFAHEWNYIPHIHETPFYCYAYAWGNLLALSLFATYKEKGDSGKKKIISVLSAGGSKSPKDILSDVGINPSSEEFWQKGFDIIRGQIDELKTLTRQ